MFTGVGYGEYTCQRRHSVHISILFNNRKVQETCRLDHYASLRNQTRGFRAVNSVSSTALLVELQNNLMIAIPICSHKLEIQIKNKASYLRR